MLYAVGRFSPQLGLKLNILDVILWKKVNKFTITITFKEVWLMPYENEEKKGFLERGTSRRDFLKFSGKSIAGAAVSLSVVGLFTKSADAEGIPLATGLLISEPSRCTGCRRCETVCTVANDGKAQPHISRVKVGRNYNFGTDGPKNIYYDQDGNLGNFTIVADTCKQCKDPVPCATVCPMGAIEAQPKTGTRVVNEDKCIGCGLCVNECPWAAITVDTEDRKAKKCFLCNGDPECVKNCPTGSLKLVPWEEVRKVMRNRSSLNA